MKIKNNGWHVLLSTLVFVILLVFAYFMLSDIFKFLGGVIGLFLPFIFGYLLSLAINPFADRLQRKLKLPRGVSAILVIVVTIGVLGGVVASVVWKIVDEVKSLYQQSPDIYNEMMMFFEGFAERYSDFYEAMPEYIQKIADSIKIQLLEFVSNFFEKTPVFEKAGDFAKSVPGVLISVIIFILSLYFMVTDARKIKRFFGKIIPKSFSEKMANIHMELKKYLGGYVKAQAIIMSIAFVLIFTGLSILGVNYALLIAIGIAVLDALPFFGSGAVLWPWALISFLNGSVKLGVGLIIIYLAIVLTRQMVEPKIVSSKLGLPPILTLMAMYVGYKTFSIGGMILGPIILMVVISFYRAGVFHAPIKLLKAIGRFIKNEYKNVKYFFKNLNDK